MESGINQSMLSLWMNGKYTVNPQRVRKRSPPLRIPIQFSEFTLISSKLKVEAQIRQWLEAKTNVSSVTLGEVKQNVRLDLNLKRKQREVEKVRLCVLHFSSRIRNDSRARKRKVEEEEKKKKKEKKKERVLVLPSHNFKDNQ